MRREALHQLAARQYGLFTRAQALSLADGLTARQVDHGLRTGRWVRVHRGVYRVAGAPTSEHQVLLAAVLAGGSGTLASHRGAAWLWAMVDQLHVDLSGPLQRSPAPGITVHRRQPTDLRAVIRRSIPCTDPLRTVLDLAATGDGATVRLALDRGISDALIDVVAVRAELGRQARKGRLGVTLLRECLEERLDGSGERASALESAMDRLIVRHDLPLPERQYRLGATTYRLDYAWPDARVAVEVDGYSSHSGLEAFCKDRGRQNAIVLAGWTVLRFTWQDVHSRPAKVADQVTRALAASRPA